MSRSAVCMITLLGDTLHSNLIIWECYYVNMFDTFLNEIVSIQKMFRSKNFRGGWTVGGQDYSRFDERGERSLTCSRLVVMCSTALELGLFKSSNTQCQKLSTSILYSCFCFNACLMFRSSLSVSISINWYTSSKTFGDKY